MKASELRITNRVSHKGKEWAVTGIDLITIRLNRFIESGSRIVIVIEDKIEGIPLTEELMDKTNLIQEGRRGIYVKGSFKIDIHMLWIYWEDHRILKKTAQLY